MLFAGEVMPGLISNCIASNRPLTRQRAVKATLSYIEAEEGDMVKYYYMLK
jgi:hypothetical protein